MTLTLQFLEGKAQIDFDDANAELSKNPAEFLHSAGFKIMPLKFQVTPTGLDRTAMAYLGAQIEKKSYTDSHTGKNKGLR
jgi:hypothetical protein